MSVGIELRLETLKLWKAQLKNGKTDNKNRTGKEKETKEKKEKK